MTDDGRRWFSWHVHHYPISGVHIVHVRLWRWTWKRVQVTDCTFCGQRH